MGMPLLIGRRDQCLWMFVWVYICVVVGSFLVSVFSSLLFLCFFFDKGGLIVFITTFTTGVAVSSSSTLLTHGNVMIKSQNPLTRVDPFPFVYFVL